VLGPLRWFLERPEACEVGGGGDGHQTQRRERSVADGPRRGSNEKQARPSHF
jgi:hypothetical protein